MFDLTRPFSLFNLFNLFTLFYVYRALQLAVRLVRERPLLSKEPLSRYQQGLAEQASFFIGVPPGVFIHELCHALSIWLFGGQVVEFGYRVFWGYVVPNGRFSAAQDWFISLAGTLGNLLFGTILWLALRHNKSSSVRFFALRAFRFQVHFGLIYYPLFTLFLPVGDWLTIYNFSATPVLSGLTAVFHATLLLLFLYADRIGWFETPSFETVEAQMQFSQLASSLNTQNENGRLAYINYLRSGHAPKRARRALQQFLQDNPHSAVGHLQQALLHSEGQRELPKKAFESAQQALNLGLTQPRQQALAHEIVARFYLDQGKGQPAREQLTMALLALGKTSESEPQQARLLHLRSQAYRRETRLDEALRDLDDAILLAQQANDQKTAVFYQKEKEIMAHTFS